MSRLSNLSRSIKGSVAVITGAASGMGRATARLFADEGPRLAIVDINAEALAEAASELREAGAEVLAVTADCARQAEVVAAIEQTAAHCTASLWRARGGGAHHSGPGPAQRQLRHRRGDSR